jgi:alpha-aminoadipic semialdehyde synthase
MNNIKELTKRNMCRLVAVGDVSCDPLGSIEFLVRTTSIDAPLFIFDPMTQNTHDQTTEGDWMYKPGILMLGVDNLPTEFPREATTYFGDNLLPFMETIAKSNFKNSYEQMANDLPEEVYRAVITANGKLTTPFEYIAEWRKRNVERFVFANLLEPTGC